MSRIFVSYSRADLEFVKKLVDDLAELGFDVLYDKRHFQGGRSTEPEIRAKIQQCDYFIPVMTGDAARSKWVRPVEVKLALKLQKDGCNIRILPLLLRKGRVEFRELSRLNYFDFTTDQPLAFAKLVQALPKVEYDELFNLQKVLDTEPFQDRTMLRLLRRMATREKRSGRLHDWAAMSAEGFMKEVRKVVHNAEDVDTAYWLLIIHGVLKFQDIENFWDESDNYKNSMKFAEVASRGVALMNELGMQQVQSRPRIRKSSSARPRKLSKSIKLSETLR